MAPRSGGEFPSGPRWRWISPAALAEPAGLAIEDLPDFSRQRVTGIRLLEQGHARFQQLVLENDIVGVSRGKQDFYGRKCCPDLPGQLAPSHTRQDHVGKEEVDPGIRRCEGESPDG